MSSHEEVVVPEEKGTKRDVDDAELDEVHSANNWEKANLGGDERHQKFLRLMGACKKEHKGRFVIGDKESRIDRTQEKTTLINKKLESQYNEGMELKLSGAARHHTGLGFKEADESEEPSTKEETKKEEPKEEEKPKKEEPKEEEKPKKEAAKTEEKEAEQTETKPEQSNGGEEPDTTKTEPSEGNAAGMKFVKAASS